MDERTSQLLSKIQGHVNYLIGKASVQAARNPALSNMHSDLIKLSHQIDSLINEYEATEELEQES